MPYVKKTYKKYRKKNKRYRKKYSKKMALPSGGFPMSKLTKLRYSEEISIDAVTSAQTYSFLANGLYDPNVTGTGHQPMNYDTWQSVYDHYTVIGSKINVRWIPNVTTNALPGIMGIALTDDGTLTSGQSLQYLIEQKLVSVNKHVIGIVSSGKYSQVTKTFSAKKFFGKPNNTMIGDDEYRGSSATNPNEKAYFEVFVVPVGGDNPGDFSLIVTIDYIAVWTEPKKGVAS